MDKAEERIDVSYEKAVSDDIVGGGLLEFCFGSRYVLFAESGGYVMNKGGGM